MAWIFQSTLSVGRATIPTMEKMFLALDFNPRSPWGERQIPWLSARTARSFRSTLSVGRATRKWETGYIANIFRSTLSVGRATLRHSQNIREPETISIHALRGESDGGLLLLLAQLQNFDPRSPWGERLRRFGGVCQGQDFDPRSPWGERHWSGNVYVSYAAFRSTLSVGRATFRLRKSLTHRTFRSTLSVGRATWRTPRLFQAKTFRSTLSVGRATGSASGLSCSSSYFDPRSPWGERPCHFFVAAPVVVFRSTLSVGRATCNSKGVIA